MLVEGTEGKTSMQGLDIQQALNLCLEDCDNNEEQSNAVWCMRPYLAHSAKHQGFLLVDHSNVIVVFKAR